MIIFLKKSQNIVKIITIMIFQGMVLMYIDTCFSLILVKNALSITKPMSFCVLSAPNLRYWFVVGQSFTGYDILEVIVIFL